MKASGMIITIGREYGSGGRDIGKALADRLEIPFYDKEILTRAAKDSGICADLFEHHDEKTTPNYLLPLLSGLDIGTAGLRADAGMPLNHRIFLAQFEAIRKLAAEGSCVIVGRCGDYILRDQQNIINLFIYAGTEARIHRIMAKEELAYDKAKEKIRKVDHQRHAYYNFFADGSWGQRTHYHLMLRSDELSIAAAADILYSFVKATSKNG